MHGGGGKADDVIQLRLWPSEYKFKSRYVLINTFHIIKSEINLENAILYQTLCYQTEFHPIMHGEAEKADDVIQLRLWTSKENLLL